MIIFVQFCRNNVDITIVMGNKICATEWICKEIETLLSQTLNYMLNKKKMSVRCCSIYLFLCCYTAS